MLKTFVLIKINNKESFKPFCEFVNAIYNLNFQILLSYKFQYFCKISFEEGHLVYVDNENKEDFLNTLKKNEIPFEVKDLTNEYNAWTNNYNVVEKLDDSFLTNDQQNIINSFDVPQIIEFPDGSQLLTEEEIVRKDNIKIYTHSNEQCGHHIPHIHVEYNNVRNFCVISLKDFKVLQPKNIEKRAKVKKCVSLLKMYIAEARLSWNKSSGKLKFKLINGKPTDDYE